MNIPGLVTLVVIAALYVAWIIWEIRQRDRYGGGETPQESHDYFAGTVCHSYTDGTRVWFNKHGDLTHYECGDSPLGADDLGERRLM